MHLAIRIELRILEMAGHICSMDGSKRRKADVEWIKCVVVDRQTGKLKDRWIDRRGEQRYSGEVQGNEGWKRY
jgi:hypothetical protein